MGREAIRVWVDDRHPIFRRGLVAVLRGRGFDVVGESARLQPRPQLSACDLFTLALDRECLRTLTKVGVTDQVALVGYVAAASEELLCEAIEAGVEAVVPRSELTPRRLVSCLRSVAAGNASLPSDLLPRLLRRAARGSSSAPAGLTDREIQVLELLADGEDTKGMAAALAYSERTIKNIVHDLLIKMNGRNRTHAVALATRQGIV